MAGCSGGADTSAHSVRSRLRHTLQSSNYSEATGERVTHRFKAVQEAGARSNCAGRSTAAADQRQSQAASEALLRN